MTNFLKVLSAMAKVAELLGRTAQLIGSAVDIHRAATDDELSVEERVVRATLGVFGVLSQGGVLASQAVGFSSEVRNTFRVAAGATQILRSTNNLYWKEERTVDDWLDFIASTAFEGSLTVEAIVALDPTLASVDRASIQEILDSIKGASILIQGREGIRRGYVAVRNFVVYFRGEVLAGRIAVNPIAMRPNAAGAPELRVDPAYANIVRAPREVNSIEEWSKIPELFRHDEVLKLYTCPLSQYPIRYAVVIKETAMERQPVYYESNAIHRWLQEHPGELPSGWPAHLPLTVEQLGLAENVQSQIDGRLHQLWEGMQELSLEDLFSSPEQQEPLDVALNVPPQDTPLDQRMIELAGGLGLHDIGNIEDVDIVDRLLAHAPTRGVATISAFTLPYAFIEGEEKRWSRMVVVQPTATKRRDGPRQLASAFRSLFGSQEPADRTALQQALQNGCLLKFYLSQDLTRIKIEEEPVQ